VRANVIPDPQKALKKENKKSENLHIIQPDSVEKLYQLKDLVVLDFRSKDAYAKGHLKNAKSLPIDSIDAKMTLSEFNKDSTYLIYAEHEKDINYLTEIFTAYEFKNFYVLIDGYEEWIHFQNKSKEK
jgi:rhodanese-related sulfurtransferase